MAEALRKSVPPARDEAPETPRPSIAPAVAPGKRSRERTAAADKVRQLRRRQRVRWALFALLPLVLIVAGYWYVTGGQVMSTDDAYVNAEKVGISTDVSGIVQDVDVTNNQYVTAGQILYRLDPRQFQIAVDSAKANLAQVALTLDAMKQDYKRMLSDVAAQQAQVDLDQTNYNRAEMLLHNGAGTQATYDQAKYALQTDTSKLQSLREQAQVQLARLGGNADTPTTELPQYLQAKAQLDEAERQLNDTVVKAPFSGIVTDVPATAPGRYLAASTTAFYLVDTDHVWVDAQPKETELTHVRAGQRGHGDGRHLSERGVAGDRSEYQPGGGAGVRAAAGAEHQRQLGESRATRADAHSPRHQRQDAAAVARRHERRGQCRYRACTRLSGLPHVLVRRRPARQVMASDSALADGGNRAAITVCVILATLMQALDTTIANVALPYMQGSVSASQDEIDWVLTSYIVAAAIMTPPTGFLASRFGIKRLFLVSVAGFTVVSMLCGAAQSLTEIVVFRVLQGAFGAALVPLSQTVLLGAYPRERQGFAMALFGVGVMVGPVFGPVLGGWLTENYSWRYVFYINLPIGIIALLGMMVFLPDSQRNAGQKLDWFGFGTLSLAVGALQLMLDRGEIKDWFNSGEIVIEAIVMASALYLFLVHTFTVDKPFVRPALFRDRNFTTGTLFMAVVGLTLYASMALQPPFLQELMDYPVSTAGIVMGPRGIGTMISMLIVGRLVGRIDTRLLLGFGLAVTAWSFYAMTGWTPDVSRETIIGVGFIQGAGLGFLFVPLSTVTLATLSPQHRTEGAGFYNLSRNIGSSIGISIVNALLTRNTQINHADIVAHVTAVNRGFEDPTIAHFWNPLTASGRAALDAVITRQAQIIAFIDDYKLLMIATLAVLPLLLIFKPKYGGAPAQIPIAD